MPSASRTSQDHDEQDSIERSELLSALEEKVKKKELTVSDVTNRIEDTAIESRKEDLRNKLQQMKAVHEVADELPEGTSVKITDEANLVIYGLQESSSYQPEFHQSPRDHKDDWAFYVNGEFAGWNSMSGGLSNLKGYRCSPSKVIGPDWSDRDIHELDIDHPSEHVTYNVRILSEQAFGSTDQEV